MHKRSVITGFVLLMVLAACSMGPIADPNMEREHIEAVSENLEDWIQLGPGFRYYERPGSIGFSIDYLSIDEATLAALEAKMQQVKSLMKFSNLKFAQSTARDGVTFCKKFRPTLS